MIDLLAQTVGLMALLLVVILVMRGTIVLGVIHRNMLEDREAELRFWKAKTDELRSYLATIDTKPQPPKVRPVKTEKRIDRSSLTALQATRDMPCQGITRPRQMPIHWDTNDGLRLCREYLGGSTRDSDDEYELVEVTTFGDPEPSYIQGRKIDTVTMR